MLRGRESQLRRGAAPKPSARSGWSSGASAPTMIAVADRFHTRQTSTISGPVRRSARQLSAQLAIDQRTLGPDHPLLAQTLIGMADVYGDSGEHEKALALYRRGLEVFRRMQADHPFLAIIRNNMGGELRQVGRARKPRRLKLALRRLRKASRPGLRDGRRARQPRRPAARARRACRRRWATSSARSRCGNRARGANHASLGIVLGGRRRGAPTARPSRPRRSRISVARWPSARRRSASSTRSWWRRSSASGA